MARREYNVESLPKWAQTKIAVLEMRIEELRARLSEGPENSRVFADPYSQTPRPLGHRADIRFQVSPDDKYPQFWVSISDDGVLEVHGSESMQMQPHAPNVVRLKLGEYF